MEENINLLLDAARQAGADQPDAIVNFITNDGKSHSVESIVNALNLASQSKEFNGLMRNGFSSVLNFFGKNLEARQTNVQKNFYQVTDEYNNLYKQLDASQMREAQCQGQAQRLTSDVTRLNAEKIAMMDQIADNLLQVDGKEVSPATMKRKVAIMLGITAAAAAVISAKYIKFRKKRELQFMETMKKHDGSQIDVSRDKSIKATNMGYSRDFVRNLIPRRTADSKQITDGEKHYLGFGGNIYRDEQGDTLNESRMASFLDSLILDDEPNQLLAEQQQQQIRGEQQQTEAVIKRLASSFGNTVGTYKFAHEQAKLEAAEYAAKNGIQMVAGKYKENGQPILAEALGKMLYKANQGWFRK